MLAELTIVDDGTDLETQIATAINGAIAGIVSEVLDDIRIPEAMRKIEEMIVGELSQNFLGSHGPDGSPYPPLKHPRPKGHNPGTRPLIDTGALLASVVSDSPGHISIATDDSLETGTQDEKAIWQQEGTMRKGVPHIPARPFVGLNDAIINQAVDIVADELIKQMGV